MRANDKRRSVNNPKPSTDYAITTDFAERLAMLARTQKGEVVRRWFQARRDELMALKQAAGQPVTDPLLIQLLTQQQAQLRELQQTVTALLERPRPAPGVYPNGSGLRQLVVHQVNAYCLRYDLAIRDGYTHFYRRLQAVYGISIFALSKTASGSFLEAIERAGHMEQLHGLVADEMAGPATH